MRITLERLNYGRGYQITMRLPPMKERSYIVPDSAVALHAIRTIIDADEWQEALQRAEKEERLPPTP